MVLPKWLTAEVLKLIAVAAVAGGAAWAFNSWLSARDAARDANASSQANERAEETAEEITDRGQAAEHGARRQSAGVAIVAERFEQKYKEGESNDTSTDRSTMPVPQWLRDAYKARRVDRERLAGLGIDGDVRAEAEDAQERADLLR